MRCEASPSPDVKKQRSKQLTATRAPGSHRILIRRSNQRDRTAHGGVGPAGSGNRGTCQDRLNRSGREDRGKACQAKPVAVSAVY